MKLKCQSRDHAPGGCYDCGFTGLEPWWMIRVVHAWWSVRNRLWWVLYSLGRCRECGLWRRKWRSSQPVCDCPPF